MGGRVLVTNDDGIDAAGLRTVTAALVAEGYEPIVVAPNRDYSGAAGSLLTLGAAEATFDQRQVRYDQRSLDEAPGVAAFAVDGPPALCALLAVREAFGPLPDLVVSGINYGLNAGPAVLHSGTVNAAITAARAGIPALAVSAEHASDEAAPMRYDTAAAVAMQVLSRLQASGHPIVSLNVPRLPLDELAGICSTPLADAFRWRSFIESNENGVITRSFRESDDRVAEGTDTAMIEQGWATISSLVGITTIDCENLADAVDLTG